MKQQFLQKDLHQINNFSLSNTVSKPEVSISRKTQKISNKKPISCAKQEQICCPSRRTVKNSIHTYGGNSLSQSTTLQPGRTNVVRNVSILQKLVTDDHLIKYTTDSSQIKRTDVELMYSRIDTKDDKKQVKNMTKKVQTNGFSLIIKKQDMINEEFDLTEIRQFQGISTRRKQKLNYEYLKQKILIEASVRKIQRAWRNYRTKKLVNCYSSQLSSRFLKTQLITSARSQARSLNLMKQKTMFKSNDLYLNNGQIEGFKDKVLNNVDNQECSSDDEEFEGQEGRKGIKFQEERPFSKKYVASTGKVEKKFFETEVIKRQEKPVRPMSPKISPKVISGQISEKIELEKQPIVIKSTQRLKKQAAIQFSTLPANTQSEIQEKLKKFQQQEIRKWQSILDSIKKGKNIEVLLQKSQRYKKQLQSNLNKQKSLNSVINRNRASPILFRQQSSKSSLGSNKPIGKTQIQKQSNILESVILNHSQESNRDEIMISQTQKIPRLSSPKNLRSHEDQSLNETAEKRKEKILFFENEILKIDNEEYSDTSSIQSFDQVVNKKEQFDELQQREREENIKLRKKLQLFNTHFLDISSADEGLTDRSLKGLKGNSTDERRNSINKRFNSNKEQMTIVPIQKQPLISHQPIEQPSSQQTRQNRRPDVVLPQSQSINAAKQPINKIHELISRKIEYPEEQEEEYASSEDSSLQYQDKHQTYAQNKFVSPESNYIDEISDQSMSSEGIVDFMGHEKHFDNDFIYGQPVMTHRQRRLQVPQLRLDTLPKKFPDSIKKMKEQIMLKSVNEQEQTSLNPKYQTSNANYNEFFQTNKKQETKNDTIIDEISVVTLPKPVPSIPKMDIKEVMKICSYLQEQLVYEGLLEFSDSSRIVQSIKGLFDNFKKQKKKLKPEGICTNLESIKDYLENFVGFVFENKLTQQIIKFLWTPSGPKAIDLLKYLRKDTEYENDQNEYIMSIEVFEKHWKYANSNIYFDKKYNDEKTEQQRVSYLKSLTRVYFRSIFDAFNESLQFQRSFGMMGKPYPWSAKITKESKKELKLAFQQAYRRILKISVVYYGVHFDDKAHLFGQDEIKQLQEERLLTLLMMELEQDEYKWSFIEDQLAQVKYDVGLMIEQAVLDEVLKELEVLVKRQLSN